MMQIKGNRVMDQVCRDIFQSIHEGCWLSIQYKNKGQDITSYWIDVKEIHVPRRMLIVDGFHLVRHTLRELSLYIDSILSSCVIEGSYYKKNEALVDDIRYHPEKYRTLFSHVSNLKVLNYLLDCSRLDTTPYKTDYGLIRYLDADSFREGVYQLDAEQFAKIVREFQRKSERQRASEGGRYAEDTLSPQSAPASALKIRRLAMNVLSIHTRKGLYVLACRVLKLDVRTRCLTPSEEITVCREFTVDGERMSIRKFLEAEDYALLDDFEGNQELIKDRITASNRQLRGVDDMPYLV